MNTKAKSRHPTWLRFIWAIAGGTMFFQATGELIAYERIPQQLSLSGPCQFKSVSNFTYGITVKSYLSPSEEAQIGPVEYVLMEDQTPIQIKREKLLTGMSLSFEGKRGKTYTIQTRFPQMKDRNTLSNADLEIKIRRWQRVLFNVFYHLVKWGGFILLGLGIAPLLSTWLRPKGSKTGKG